MEASPAGAASSEAEPPVVAAASNAVVLTVTICQDRLFRLFQQNLSRNLYLNWVQGLEGHDGIASIHCPDKGLAILHQNYIVLNVCIHFDATSPQVRFDPLKM